MKDGWTALMSAANHGYYDVVKVLVGAKGIPDPQGPDSNDACSATWLFRHRQSSHP